MSNTDKYVASLIKHMFYFKNIYVKKPKQLVYIYIGLTWMPHLICHTSFLLCITFFSSYTEIVILFNIKNSILSTLYHIELAWWNRWHTHISSNYLCLKVQLKSRLRAKKSFQTFRHIFFLLFELANCAKNFQSKRNYVC